MPEIRAGGLNNILQKRGDRKAGGFDGWRTTEAKAVPVVLLTLVAKVLTWIEEGQDWPSAFRCVPLPALKKGTGEFAIDQRLLGLMSVWYSAWGALRRKHTEPWRASLFEENMCARPGSSITDVFWPTQLRLENAEHQDLPLASLMLDREKCFDRIPYSFILKLQEFLK